MSKSFVATLILCAACLPAAHAAPQDDLDKFLVQKGLMSRLGDTIQQATDRAGQLVSHAMQSLGVPYRMGGTSAEGGFDCSGFVRAMYQQTVGLMLPRTAAEQAAATSRIDKADLKPGDLVFFNTLRRTNSHVGIYVGDGKFIHSPRTGAHVRVESMNISYWQARFDGARRVLQETDKSTTTATADTSKTTTVGSGSSVIDRASPAPRTIRLGGTFGKSSGSGPTTPAETAPSPSAGDSI
ncbi:NlpC/P60 family protein [Ottowia sp. GY511]|uniref:C40 family peptidase n=1 Tax=Ottowia flava TaxID=2675430 RepID=A0ABW4KU00_9BURK|nr:C40 family peptidase [Ottowia sp. GY511]TXK33550.1 NlpC/P60 family protein [Ottowia sp. GY511]